MGTTTFVYIFLFTFCFANNFQQEKGEKNSRKNRMKRRDRDAKSAVARASTARTPSVHALLRARASNHNFISVFCPLCPYNFRFVPAFQPDFWPWSALLIPVINFFLELQYCQELRGPLADLNLCEYFRPSCGRTMNCRLSRDACRQQGALLVCLFVFHL